MLYSYIYEHIVKTNTIYINIHTRNLYSQENKDIAPEKIFIYFSLYFA